MNIQLAHQKVKEFLAVRVKIDAWDLDVPEGLYSPTSNNYQPGSSAIALPIQNLVHKKVGLNLIETSVRLPYRITYRFAYDLAYDALLFNGLEGVLSTVHLLSLLQLPDENIKSFQPAEVEDSITVERIAQKDGDWLVNLNFAFDVVFNTTDFPDISSIQPADYYNIENPPPLSEITIRTNRAKPEFKKSNTSTYIEDSTINITK
ncbi:MULTISPECIES: hypothetical protein [unclassified Nostoc]|uniref:hypothetical protein n=1 Tax=unclassified Nostoc TaxID=2593658 RepID=UPI002AD26C77|nr:hypothetical protein [Nostoc sp. DedQUE03]MDZ7975526.1 hypothetical protein [Nostoc sp. DedQUE03]MDZ8045579.1 hypothetical protein [Nostoc sp. DedQUE02]